MPVLRIAGGLVVTRVGFGMLDPPNNPRVSDAETQVAQQTDLIAFTPIAMPLLAGPGSIAATIALATETTGLVSNAGVAAGVVVVALASWLTLRFSSSVVALVGPTGMNALSRLMGLILICIGITFIATGFFEGLTGDVMTGVLRAWIERLNAA